MIMSITVALVLLIFVVTLILCFIKTNKKNNKGAVLPPGPRGLPLLGNIHQVAKNAPVKFSQWAEEYGKLFTIHLGHNAPALVVSDPHLIKQLFGTMAATGKFKTEMFELIFEGSHGIFNTEGKQWLEQRHFAARTLKHFGFGDKRSVRIESMMLTEIEHLSRQLELDMKTKGTVHISEIMKQASGATLWAMTTGRRITSQEVDLLEEWTQSLQKAANTGFFFFPWMKYLAPEWTGYRQAQQFVRRMHDIVNNFFQQQKHVEEEEDDVTNIISAYVNQMRKMEQKPDSTFHGDVGLMHSIKSIMALLAAGIETTATTLNWLIFYLAVHPDVQRKVHQEIDELIGDQRDPNLGDQNQMSYMEAVILETLRMSSSIPLGIIHKLVEDLPFQQYTLPKGLYLIANIYHIHHTPSIWGDPENFRPERFLDSHVTFKENLVSFQPGRRSCVGEPLARDALFLFATKLFQTFNFLPEAAGRDRKDYMEGEMGFLYLPRNIGIRVSRRGK